MQRAQQTRLHRNPLLFSKSAGRPPPSLVRLDLCFNEIVSNERSWRKGGKDWQMRLWKS